MKGLFSIYHEVNQLNTIFFSDVERHEVLEKLVPMYEVLQHGVIVDLGKHGKKFVVAQIADCLGDGQESNHMCGIFAPSKAKIFCRSGWF